MAKPHFAIERPRRINIAIPGYNPQANLKKQTAKKAEQARRKARHDQRETAAKTEVASVAQVEALAQAAATPPVPHDDELIAAFAGPSSERVR